MLQAKTIEQKQHINTLLDKMQIAYSDAKEDGVLIDDFISYEDMAKIVDFLRTYSPQKELFEECWIAYKRKGSKKKSLEYWKKLTDGEKQNVLAHIKAYVSTRDLQFQKDFERYLRDKIFTTIVFKDNRVIFDPTKNENGTPYTPMCDGAISWNDYYNCYILVGMYYGKVFDGYTDDNRPNGARIMLGNGGGFIAWNSETKTWDKVQN